MDPAFHRPAPKPAQTTDDLPLFAPPPAPAEVARKRRALEAQEDGHKALVAELRAEARRVYDRTGRPVSTNDIRHLLPPGVDARVLGVVFNSRAWKRVGLAETAHEGATRARVGSARSAIGTYVPAPPVAP